MADDQEPDYGSGWDAASGWYDDMDARDEFHVLARDVLVASILLGLTSIVGLVGNALMLRALVRYDKLRIDFYILLASVAAADILCLLIAVPMHIIYLTETALSTADSWCKASKYLDAGSGFVAAYHLVVLAVLRGILLTSRGRNPPTPRQSLVCIGVLWIIAFLAAIPFLLTVEDVEGFCHYTLDANVEKEVWLMNAFSCFVPVGLILLIYLLTHLVGQRYFEDSYSYREKQMSKLVTVIVVFFVILQLPFRALDIQVLYKEMETELSDSHDEDSLVSLYIARNYLLCVMMADKAVRPVICAKLAPDLAGAFDEVINCTMCHRVYTGSAGGGRASNNNNQRKGSRRSGRYPSTSSNAPLTDGQGVPDPGPEDATANEEMEIVQL